MPDDQIRVRIAPSPTGNLHVGTARAALFNELYARHASGSFVIRIEDTDKERSKSVYEKTIIDGLSWLGISWDEGPDIGGPFGPYRQSERVGQHRNALEKLLDAELAYRCYCAPKEKSGGEVHTCTCPENTKHPADARFVIRLKVEPQEISFTDIVRGEVRVHTNSFGGDFVIARSLDDPLFHLAVVVDDADMHITHVIRGEDHLHNTIKHILIQQACGYKQPVYAHLPLILDEQRRKLSKRAGETNLMAYKEMGYLPEAMLNYLALLGWGAKDDREIFSHDELIQAFTLDSVQKAGAIFSIKKLQSINKHYIRQLTPEQLFEKTEPFLTAAGIDTADRAYITKALTTEQERVATLGELPQAIDFFLPAWSPDYEPEMLVWRKSTPKRTVELLELLSEKLSALSDEQYTEEKIQEHLMAWIDEYELGRGDTLWPMRVALTGKEKSPGPFEVAAVLSKQVTLDRIDTARNMLSHA